MENILVFTTNASSYQNCARNKEKWGDWMDSLKQDALNFNFDVSGENKRAKRRICKGSY